MAILHLKRGNTPLEDEQGFVNASIVGVSMTKETKKVKDLDQNFDIHEVEHCVFLFECPGTSNEPFHIHHKCFPRLDGEKHVFRGKGRGTKEKRGYNKLTKTCVRLGLVTDEKLIQMTEETLNNVMTKLDMIDNLPVRFKSILNLRTNEYGVDLDTLERR